MGEIKLHDRAQTCHWRVKLKLFVFVIFSCFPFFFFFFHNTELYDTTFRSCCKMNNSKKLLSMFGISFVME